MFTNELFRFERKVLQGIQVLFGVLFSRREKEFFAAFTHAREKRLILRYVTAWLARFYSRERNELFQFEYEVLLSFIPR